MFRTMRRTKQCLNSTQIDAILNRASAGVLALNGGEGYPYAVPLNYVYQTGRIYFHSAKTGHKIAAIIQDDHVSFCVIDRDEVIPERYTNAFCSVIVFGRARIVEDNTEKALALRALADKYASDHGCLSRDYAPLQQVAVIALDIEHMSGKIGSAVRDEKKL